MLRAKTYIIKKIKEISMDNKDFILPNLIKKVTYQNLGKKSAKPASFSFRLSNRSDLPLFYTSSSGSSKKLEGYQDPETGLFITNDSLHDKAESDAIIAFKNNSTTYSITSAIGSLYQKLQTEMEIQIKNKLESLEMAKKHDIDAYNKTYKPLDVIAAQLYDHLDNNRKFMAELYAEIRSLPDLELPQLNNKLLYTDDDWKTAQCTSRVPFKNPANQELTQKQIDLVNSFLSVFFDGENRKIFSWMMGTVVMNKPIYMENISRFFLLYSKIGGVGKSTIMRVIANGLFGPDYVATTPEFDTYFLAGDRFRSSNLSRKRVVIYDEATFNGPLDTQRNHDFHGLNEDVIKAFATSGDLNIEEKFKQMKTTTFKNIHFILTNFLPVVPENRPDLGRRFLPCMLKPTKMQDKAKLLNNMTVEQMTKYVKDNGQAFLNYFAHAYSDNPKWFDTYTYSHVNTAKQEQTAVDQETKLEQARKLVSTKKDKLQKLDAFALLTQLSKDLAININDLLYDCANALPAETKVKRSTKRNVKYTDKKYPNIHYIINKQENLAFLCIQTNKQTFNQYSNGDSIHESLSLLYPKVKKFAQKVFMLPIHDYAAFVNAIKQQIDMNKSQTASTDLNTQSKDTQDDDINTPSVFDAPKSKPNYENMGIINVFDQLSTTTHVDFSALLKDIKAYAPTMKQLANNPVYQPKQASQFIYELTDNVLYIYVDKHALNDYSNGADMYHALSDNIQIINKFDHKLFVFRLNDKQ